MRRRLKEFLGDRFDRHVSARGYVSQVDESATVAIAAVVRDRHHGVEDCPDACAELSSQIATCQKYL